MSESAHSSGRDGGDGYQSANGTSRTPAKQPEAVAVVRTPFDTTRPRDIAYYMTLLDWRYPCITCIR